MTKKKPLALHKKDGRPRRFQTAAQIGEEIRTLKEWMNNPNGLYLLEWMNARGLTYDMVSIMRQTIPEFAEIFAQAKQVSEQKLVQLAIDQPQKAGFIKFLLINKNNYRNNPEYNPQTINNLSLALNAIAANQAEIIQCDD
jgi:hypothetical protein